MSVLHLLAAPAAAHAPLAADGYDLGSGRLVPTLAAVVGLIGVLAAGWAFARSGRGSGGNAAGTAMVALAAGTVSVAVAGLHLASADGGPGTGNGVVAGVLSLVFGLAALVMGGLAWARSRRLPSTRTGVADRS